MGIKVLATQARHVRGYKDMAGQIKPVPAGAEQTQSFQFFRDTVQAELDKAAKAAGKTPVKFDLDKAKVWNRVDGDGSFELVYNDESLDFFCGAQVNWQSHEILIRSGKISKAKEESAKGKLPGRPVAGKWMDDACSATEKLAGKEEMLVVDASGNSVPATCQDGIGDPKLVGADKYTSIQEFEKQCKSLFDDYGRRKFGEKMGSQFDLKRARIFNAFPGDGNYSVLFENRANNFFCEGMVDSSMHTMLVRSGSIQDLLKETGEVGTPIPMNDACSMTTGLLGKNELLDPDKCKDVTAGERDQQNWISLGWHGFLTVTAGWSAFKLYRKLSAMPRVQGLFRLPIIRNLGWGALTYLGYDTIASNFVPEDHWARKYGSPVAGGAGLVAPEIARATGLATRLSSVPALGRLAPIASRASIGLAAVWVMNKGFQWGIGSEYEASVNRRVTDNIYDKHVYELDGWDFLVLPLALKGVRAGSRLIAPDAMEWAVARDNKKLKADIYEEDKKSSEQGEEFMRQVIPLFLYAENSADQESFVKMLRNGPEISIADMPKAIIFINKGAEGLKNVFPEMNDEEVELIARKAFVYQIQQAAKFMVFVEQPVNDWARELFNSDGTLKSGDESLKKLKDRWPPPKHATMDSHELELSESLSKYG